ncbi:MAG: helix-turn-helix transcriptional regulator [Agathobacter sp.]|nr:helix-turn-helix transcriptional regulator [Agathobacter sp.]
MNRPRPEYDMKAMGLKMKYYRRLRNLTVEDVRMYMKFSSVQAIYKWESGKCFPSADNLLALAELYNVNPVDLMPKKRILGESCIFEATNVLVERHCKNNTIDYMICA